MPPSRRLQAGALLFVTLLTLSLWLASGPGWGWRLLAGSASVFAGWSPVRTILFRRGKGAVRQFVWARDGQWRIRSRAGWMDADISSRTAAFGPWMLLVWEATANGGGAGRPYFALIDGAYVSPGAFRALRGRLKLALFARRPPRALQ